MSAQIVVASEDVDEVLELLEQAGIFVEGVSR